MSIKNRLGKIETNNAQAIDDWLEGLSDEELERIAAGDGNDEFAEWLTTLTDDELETIRYGKPGAKALRGKFNEYQKQNQKD